MKLNKFFYILLGLIVFIATLLRFYRLPEFLVFLGDQGRDAVIIKRIVTLEDLPAIGPPTSIGHVFLGPFFYYLMAPFLLLFWFNPAGLGYATAFLWLVGLIVIFWIIKKEINTLTAFIFLIIATFSHALITMARFAWNPNLLPLFAFLTLHYYYKTVSNKSKTYEVILFGALLSFSVQLHYLAILILPTILLYTILFVRTPLKEFFKKMGISLASFLVFYSPLILFDLRHNFINSKSFMKMFSEEEIIEQSSYIDRLGETVKALVNHLSTFSPTPTTALMLFSLLVVLLAFIYFKFKKHNAIVIHGMHFIIYPLAFAFLTSQRYPHYYTPLYLSAIVVIAYLLSLFSKNVLGKLAIVGVLLFYIYINIPQYYFFFNEPGNQIERAQKIAKSISGEITGEPYQVVSLPFTETDGQIRYFLELNGKTPLPDNTIDDPKELFVLCYEKKCEVLGNAQWQIAAFYDAQIEKTWKTEGITVYKLTHKQ